MSYSTLLRPLKIFLRHMIDFPAVCYDPRMSKHPGCGNANYALFEHMHLTTLIETENALRLSRGMHPVPKTTRSHIFSSPFPPYLTTASMFTFLEAGIQSFIRTYVQDPDKCLDKAFLVGCEAGLSAVQKRTLHNVVLPIVFNVVRKGSLLIKPSVPRR